MPNTDNLKRRLTLKNQNLINILKYISLKTSNSDNVSEKSGIAKLLKNPEKVYQYLTDDHSEEMVKLKDTVNKIENKIQELLKIANAIQLEKAFKNLIDKHQPPNPSTEPLHEIQNSDQNYTYFVIRLADVLQELNSNKKHSKKENILKNEINNILYYLKLKANLPFHQFGTIFKFIFNSEYRQSILQNFRNNFIPSKVDINRLPDLKRANKIVYAAITADLLFWVGLGLSVAGIFFPPVLAAGIILLALGITTHAYLDIEHIQRKKTEEKVSHRDSYQRINKNLDSQNEHELDEDDRESIYSDLDHFEDDELNINEENSENKEITDSKKKYTSEVVNIDEDENKDKIKRAWR